MHVCFIEDTRLRGGTQIWVSEAIRRFLEAGAEVSLLCPADGFNARDARETGARLVTYDYEGVVRADRDESSLWREALMPADVAVCTVHPPRGGFHCSSFAASVIAATGLDCVLLPKTGTIVRSYERRFYVPEEPIAYQVIAIAEFTRRQLIERYHIPERDVSLIYQGTDVVRYTPDPARLPEAHKRHPLPAEAEPVLGCFGTYEQRKGQRVLFEAVARARHALPRIQLLLLGEGPDEAPLRALAHDLDIERHVSFQPFTSEPEYAFERIDLLVLSSIEKEGLPNVVLEAMAMQVPVVCSRLAGTPEAVVQNRTGALVEPGDADELAAAIIRLGRDAELRRALGRAGRARACELFDKNVQFDRFLAAFERIAGRRRRPTEVSDR